MLIKKYFTAVLLLSLLCFLFSCKNKHHNITRGFYYWKTVYKPSDYELKTLKKLHVTKMYIRLFDVDWDEQTQQPMPVAPAQLPAKMEASFDFVPVVFITQKTLLELNTKSIGQLAGNINDFIKTMCSGAGIHPSEIQIDCDWTTGTKDIYFQLLTELKKQEYFKGKTISCTIRMHQVKYTVSSGIPPVDKGLLMCYSMGDIKKSGVRNSILDVDEAKNYLKRINTYPLPLDIALPLFQWCILFRQQKFVGILHEIAPSAITGNKLFVHKEGNLYSCKTDTLWQGVRLKAKDIIRTETASYEALMDIAEFTSQQLSQPRINVLLFSCDSITLSKYSIDELESVYNTYR